MAEFDLIPPDYARRKLLMRWLRVFVMAFAAVALFIGTARAALQWLLVKQRSEVAQLQEQGRFYARDKQREQQFAERVGAVRRQLVAYEELTGQDTVLVFVSAIDAAYVDGVWFDELRLLRTEQPRTRGAASPPAQAARPATSMKDDAGNGSAIRHSGEIVGHAVSHVALAEFLRRLAGQPGVSTVQLAESNLRASGEFTAIEARIALVLDAKRRAP